MLHTDLSENIVRQMIDAAAIYRECMHAAQAASKFAGTMSWKREGDYEYLIKSRPRRRLPDRLGRRDAHTEQVMQAYTSQQREARERLATLEARLEEAQRVNRALRVGRTPNIVVQVLNQLQAAGLAEHFRVVGTHALYAYEAAAGVRFAPDALATRDIDLLWDARRRVQFQTDLQRLDGSVLKTLQRVDRSFRRKEGQLESAINADAFEVDFLRRQPVDGDPHPMRFSPDDEDDMWPVQALRADQLTNAVEYSQIVFATNGAMALMRTIAPTTFVEFKQWMATLKTRQPIKRRRDQLQATAVQQLLDDGLLLDGLPDASTP